jgi:hypothetical protein
MTSAIIVASRYAIPSLDQTDEIFGTHNGYLACKISDYVTVPSAGLPPWPLLQSTAARATVEVISCSGSYPAARCPNET